ncbi:MAG TPA: 4Fe-4S binding protein, partial [Magnetospirillum sp.]|nr:4Fe-4S binding protein [Magnetospirillum sp.]
MVKLLAVLVVLLGWTSGCRAAGLADFLDQIPLDQVFPGAERLGPPEGSPAAAPALKGDQVLGWVFLNSDWVNAAGYSGKPIQVAVGMDKDGRIVGAKLLKHAEPIVLVGIPQKKIEDFIAGYIGRNVLETVNPASAKGPDIVSGATVTVMVIGDTMVRSGILVARAKGIGGQAPPAQAERRQVDFGRQGTASWDELVGDGSIRRLHLTVGDVNRAFAERGDPRAAQRPEPGEDNDDFLDLYLAEVTTPVIGRSLLGEREYQALMSRLGGRPAVLVMGQGRYSFRGSGYVRGGIFDRFELVQDASTIRFRDKNYERLGDVAAQGAPQFSEIGLFAVPEGTELDPAQPFVLQLLVQRPVGALEKVFITFDLTYRLPEKWLKPAAPAPKAQAVSPVAAAPAGGEALWLRIWQAKAVEIGILVAALAVLTLIFFFQDVLVKRPRLTAAIRWTFLAFTLVWVGWYADAQLSVVNILALSSALVTGFSWDYFLMDPLLFILWSAVAAALLFWGRGAFCGWLCPFGALQEFVSLVAKRLKVPQITVPWGLHERLWPIKYVIFLGLFGFALYSLA